MITLAESLLALLREDKGVDVPPELKLTKHLELLKTPLKTAREFAGKCYSAFGYDLDADNPKFDRNFAQAQHRAKRGWVGKRIDMPVINVRDIKALQARLMNGEVDIRAPFSKPDYTANPFPHGLTGQQAQAWLEGGLKVNDGDANDDRVNVHFEMVAASDLQPIQAQIYLDRSLTSALRRFPLSRFLNYVQKETIIICSLDNAIIDGHHRYLSTMLLDPSIKLRVLKIDMEIDRLLPFARAYGDAIGNPRNP